MYTSCLLLFPYGPDLRFMFIVLCAWLPCFVFFNETHRTGEFQLLVCSLSLFFYFVLLSPSDLECSP